MGNLQLLEQINESQGMKSSSTDPWQQARVLIAIVFISVPLLLAAMWTIASYSIEILRLGCAFMKFLLCEPGARLVFLWRPMHLSRSASNYGTGGSAGDARMSATPAEAMEPENVAPNP
jgi:hypothetical protein